ncbi:Hypothetical predicted protein [Mytilus galloprovincialis]|uniref:PiggyBac transposable element-derived protein domain-containing protein n=1 Tax=Mytilus galloprovincialis TaxID=29158 RepID=A0A8B6DAV2_MYTGA|nr:Hypothetical predicted protein [Mytilus galloprovincialis]
MACGNNVATRDDLKEKLIQIRLTLSERGQGSSEGEKQTKCKEKENPSTSDVKSPTGPGKDKVKGRTQGKKAEKDQDKENSSTSVQKEKTKKRKMKDSSKSKAITSDSDDGLDINELQHDAKKAATENIMSMRNGKASTKAPTESDKEEHNIPQTNLPNLPYLPSTTMSNPLNSASKLTPQLINATPGPCTPAQTSAFTYAQPTANLNSFSPSFSASHQPSSNYPYANPSFNSSLSAYNFPSYSNFSTYTNNSTLQRPVPEYTSSLINRAYNTIYDDRAIDKLDTCRPPTPTNTCHTCCDDLVQLKYRMDQLERGLEKRNKRKAVIEADENAPTSTSLSPVELITCSSTTNSVIMYAQDFITSRQRIRRFSRLHSWFKVGAVTLDEMKGFISKSISEHFKKFHIVDNTTIPNRNDDNYSPTSKFQCFVDLFNRQSKQHYIPKQNLSIDESLIASKGRSSIIQYIPSKAAKFGVKLWVLAEAVSGYICQISVYKGKQYDPTPQGMLQGAYVVNKLLDAAGLFNKAYHLFTDSFFSSINLAKELLAKGTLFTGTLRANRQMPNTIKESCFAGKGEHLY